MRSEEASFVELRLADARRGGWPSARLYALRDTLLSAHEGLAPMLERGAGRVALFDQNRLATGQRPARAGAGSTGPGPRARTRSEAWPHSRSR